MLQDNYRHKGLRKQLVEQIRDKGVRNERVLKAIDSVPRHWFMESFLQHKAYIDSAFPIGAGQTISQPFTVAFQTELLDVQKGHKVLEIGTGSGYQTAILVEIGAKVYTIERQHSLFLKTQSLLPRLGYDAFFFYGDGFQGKPTYGPYDRVLVTAGAPFIPEALLLQLKIGGKFVLPVDNGDSQQMILIEKISDTDFKRTLHGNFMFVPMLKGVSKK